ncbi:unnamed protein product [Leptosia nina]|uniref:Uncharacterized protein n=1 Tax=Leptosia nina TaxID=320188 RepID=A0AAV1IX81_9NEOP
MERRTLCVFFVVTLLVNGFCLPAHRSRRQDSSSIETTTSSSTVTEDVSLTDTKDNASPQSIPIDPSDDDDDDDDDIPPSPVPSSGGSNIFSLLNVLGAILPGSSSSSFQPLLQNAIGNLLKRLPPRISRRQDMDFNIKPPTLQRQEDDEKDSNSETSESNEESDEKNSNQELDSEMSSDDDDYDEPEGDGQGGLLGLLAGLSGGEDGQSDLGSLLATVSGIIANLSGDGIDLNSLIASGIGLFVGILSEGNENPGSVIASYFLTSLDTITGGGATNNGAFFGNLLSKLAFGTSAVEGQESNSDETGDQPEMKDSAGFFSSLLMALLGNMSKTSSSGSHP